MCAIAKQIPHQSAQRALAIVADLGQQPDGMIPWHVRAYDCAEHASEESRNIRVVRKALHPALDVPDLAVGHLDKLVRRIVDEIHM